MPTAKEELVPRPERAGKIRLVIQTNLLHIQHFHRLPDSRVLDFLKRRDPFRLGVGKLGAIVKKKEANAVHLQ